MKKILPFFMLFILAGCGNNPGDATSNNSPSGAATSTSIGGQENVQDDVSQKDIVKIALGSADHTTLVEALKKADLVTSLANAGPFTVFAPTNEAFNKLPEGTLKSLMKDENKNQLTDILQYHVFVSALQPDFLNNDQVLNMANGDNIEITQGKETPVINGNVNILASIPAANGMVYVVDNVLVPQSK